MSFTILSYIETRKTISTITNLETMLVLQWKMQSLRYYCYKYMALWLVSPIIYCYFSLHNQELWNISELHCLIEFDKKDYSYKKLNWYTFVIIKQASDSFRSW